MYFEGGRHLSEEEAAYLSTLFDIGGISGGIVAGYLADRFKAKGLTCALFVTLSIPVLVR